MRKGKIKLPDFETIDEMAEFFDKHSPLDIEGFEEVDIKFVKAEDTPKKVPRLKLKRHRSRHSS